MSDLLVGYLVVCIVVGVPVFLICVAIMRWAFGINKIISELEAIRKAVGGVAPVAIENKQLIPGHPEGCPCRDCRKLRKENSDA